MRRRSHLAEATKSHIAEAINWGNTAFTYWKQQTEVTIPTEQSKQDFIAEALQISYNWADQRSHIAELEAPTFL